MQGSEWQKYGGNAGILTQSGETGLIIDGYALPATAFGLFLLPLRGYAGGYAHPVIGLELENA